MSVVTSSCTAVLKGQLSEEQAPAPQDHPEEQEPAPQDGPELVEVQKFALYFSLQKKIRPLDDEQKVIAMSQPRPLTLFTVGN